MAKTLREGKKIIFADGIEREICPLTIRQLRKFMKVMKQMNLEANENNMSDEDIDNMVEAASVALEKVDPKLAADKDGLEDILDISVFNDLLAAAMGTDPNE